MGITSKQLFTAARIERDRAIAAYLKAKRRHRGVTQARARLDNAVETLARLQHGVATTADVRHLYDLVNPKVADPIGYLRERLGLAA